MVFCQVSFRAERKRKLDNISDLGLKIIEGSNNLESERSTASETHAENTKLREEQISESKKLLQGYLIITDPKPIISALPKTPHSVRRRNLSVRLFTNLISQIFTQGKNKKQMEEAEDKFEIANVARFISVASASLGHCLRVLPTPTDFEIVKSTFYVGGIISKDGSSARWKERLGFI